MTESTTANINVNPVKKSVPILSIISMSFFHSLFYGVIGIVIYWILTINIPMLITCGIIIFLQSLVPSGRRVWYRNFVMKYLKPQ
jgi:hypothetical protein